MGGVNGWGSRFSGGSWQVSPKVIKVNIAHDKLCRQHMPPDGRGEKGTSVL